MLTYLLRLLPSRRPVPVAVASPVHRLPFILPGNHLIHVEAETCQAALLVIRRDYGVRAAKEAFLAE